MKVTVNIDCTPEEARAFMGLPDVQPMQKAMLAEMEKRIVGSQAISIRESVDFPAPEGEERIRRSPRRVMRHSTFWTCSRI